MCGRRLRRGSLRFVCLAPVLSAQHLPWPGSDWKPIGPPSWNPLLETLLAPPWSDLCVRARRLESRIWSVLGSSSLLRSVPSQLQCQGVALDVVRELDHTTRCWHLTQWVHPLSHESELHQTPRLVQTSSQTDTDRCWPPPGLGNSSWLAESASQPAFCASERRASPRGDHAKECLCDENVHVMRKKQWFKCLTFGNC